MVENDNTGDAGARVLSQPVLVPLDGTDVAEGILPFVCQFAAGENFPLIFHGIVETDAIDYPISLAPTIPQAQEAGVFSPVTYRGRQPSPARREGVIYKDQVEASALTHAEDRLRTITDRLDDQGVKTQIKTTLGSPAEEIIRVAAEEGCGLIAMSTHGRNAIGRTILGSVTDRVIQNSTVPVLTIAPERAKEYQAREGVSLRTVMLPLDGSELAEQAIPYVEALARALSLEVLLVRVVDLDYPVYAYPAYTQMAGFTDDRINEATKYLKGVSQELKSNGLTVRTRILRGSPARALLDLAHRTPNDLIVLTTHGRSGLSRWLIGSVANALIRASGDPVLVVRPKS